MEDSDVYIGSFMFCRKHGCEFCNSCYTDHRLCNNMQIMDKLSAAYPDLTENHFSDRPPISNILEKIAIESKSSRPKERVYECRDHHKTDCSNCFDWGRLAVNNMKHQAKSSNSKVIAVDITRDEKLKLLHSMGIEFPPSTRLPGDAIDKKFRHALDATQSFEKLIDKLPFDPSCLPRWSESTSGETQLVKHYNRSNLAETLADAQAGNENTFMNLRRCMMAIAKGVDNNNYAAIIQDKETSYAVCIRVVEVRTIGKEPVMMVLYGRGTRENPANATLAWACEVMSDLRAKQMPVLMITASPEEQKLLLAILNMNARRLSPDYPVERRRTEASFMLSFLLPICPIGQRDVGKLTKHTGCFVCGKKTTSKCSLCLSVEYCGTACQRSHWKEHKPMCNSLKGGDWVDITFSMMSAEIRLAAAMGQKLYMFSANNMSSNIVEDNKTIAKSHLRHR